ncbi:MAG TPA: VOC family protein [Cryomorphaceae bacterium]|nr:VOC family protein [Owenweeksia sp.]MBF98547.1 VOC family protein [Owenweeksia sp.]HAD96099.1 VOC family protein [Cryomorphaceae bacterium]HBF18503.1 VOC family protein [Cryomorphaceae bacterium]HCQ16979.1 VOC family protein [Cryomorphaceae bacterium]|tara:strand:+ start:254 stop:673 length:420 start_codon:yes stop_codon:yes gene_type:complete
MKINPYLNFGGHTEAAFNFYRSVFGGEFLNVNRFGENPDSTIPDPLKDKIMHITLPIDNSYLMGSDAPEEMGFTVQMGNNTYIMISPDSREETKRVFEALAAGGTVETDLQDMFWGDYYGSLTDKYGVQWMLNYSKTQH